MFRYLSLLFSPINKLWQPLSPFSKNIIFGLLITLLLIGLRQEQWTTDIEDFSIDWMTTFYRGHLVTENTPPFVILDINDSTYQAWGESSSTSDKLLQLLQLAVKNQPTVIIVDMVINNPLHPAKDLSLNDLALQQYIAQYEKIYCHQFDCPNILLTRTFRASIALDSNQPPDYLAQRTTFLDKIVMRSPHIYWATTQFKSEHNHLLRRWALWTPTCTQNMPDIIPSTALLVTALLTEADNSNTLSGACRLRHYLSYFLPNCHQGSKQWTREALQHKPTELKLSNDLIFELHPTQLSRRMLFTIPWYFKSGKRRPLISNGQPLLTILSAKKIIEKQTPFEPLRDSIVIISNSNKNQQEWYTTPLGEMPEMLVLVNSIQSLQQYGILPHPPIGWLLLFATLLIVLISWLLIIYGQLWGTIYATFLIIASIPLSLIIFKYGIWLNFLVPGIAVQLRHIVDF